MKLPMGSPIVLCLLLCASGLHGSKKETSYLPSILDGPIVNSLDYIIAPSKIQTHSQKMVEVDKSPNTQVKTSIANVERDHSKEIWRRSDPVQAPTSNTVFLFGNKKTGSTKFFVKPRLTAFNFTPKTTLLKLHKSDSKHNHPLKRKHDSLSDKGISFHMEVHFTRPLDTTKNPRVKKMEKLVRNAIRRTFDEILENQQNPEVITQIFQAPEKVHSLINKLAKKIWKITKKKFEKRNLLAYQTLSEVAMAIRLIVVNHRKVPLSQHADSSTHYETHRHICCEEGLSNEQTKDVSPNVVPTIESNQKVSLQKELVSTNEPVIGMKAGNDGKAFAEHRKHETAGSSGNSTVHELLENDKNMALIERLIDYVKAYTGANMKNPKTKQN